MTTLDRPTWILGLWRSRGSGKVYAQLPSGDVLVFDATENALGKILKLALCVEDQPGYVTGRQNVADHVLKKPIKVSKKTESKRKMQALSQERRSRLADLIKKHNVKEDK